MIHVRSYPLISDQIEYDELAVIVQKLEQVISKDIPGDIVELGCYEGTTSLFLQRVLIEHASNKSLHVYDSFSGLPHKSVEDQSPAGEQFIAGELQASRQKLINHFKHAGLPLPVIHKVWFELMKPKDVPPLISFAFLDGDFYTSITASLSVITQSLAPGAIVIIDDYQSEALPGAKKATDTWAKRFGLYITTQHSLGIVTWPY